MMRGYWQLYEGQSALARDSFTAALQHEPANPGARLGYGFALFYPVSYTHLDVYKRQVLGTSALGRPSRAPVTRSSMMRHPAAANAPCDGGPMVSTAESGLSLIHICRNARIGNDFTWLHGALPVESS